MSGLLRDHDVYDRATGSWSSLAQAPASIGSFIGFIFGAAVGSHVYVSFTGDWYAWQPMEDYNDTTQAWAARAAPLDLAHRTFRMVGCRDRVVLIDNRGIDYIAFQEYTIAWDSWADRGQTEFFAECGVACHLMGKVYFCGGQGYNVRKNYEYNPNTFTCTEKADPPYIVRTEEPTYTGGMIQIGQVGADFCAGTQGGVIVSSPFYYSDYFLCVYDPKTDTWTSQARVWPEGHWYQGQFCDGGIS